MLTGNVSTHRGLRRRAAATVLVAAIGVLGAGAANAADLAIVPIIPPPPPPPPVVDECDDTSYYAEAYYLRMTRADPSPAPLVSYTPGDGAVLDASDFDFGWSRGIEGRTGFIYCRIGVEIGGFFIAPWTAAYDTFAGDDIIIETSPLTNIPDAGDVSAINETLIWGLDANVVFKPNQNLLLFGGVAFIQLVDLMEIEIDGLTVSTQFPDAPYGDYIWATINNMVGPQVGVRATVGSHMPGTFFAGGDIRAGILFNWANTGVFVDRNDPVPGDLTGTNQFNTIVPMLGAGVHVGFQATANIAFTAGYQALWLGNVALAPDQVAVTGALDGLGPAVVPMGQATNSFLTHGIEVGIRLTF